MIYRGTLRLTDVHAGVKSGATMETEFDAALRVMLIAHDGQKRKNLPEPYAIHPIRVALYLKQRRLAWARVGANASSVIAAGLLHDVPEDTAVTLAMLKGMKLFAPLTLDIVDRLTKWWSDHEPAANLVEAKARYYGRILDSPEATVVKVADRIDNLQDMLRMAKAQPTKSILRWARNYVTKSDAEFVLVLRQVDAELVADFTQARNALAAWAGEQAEQAETRCV